MSTSSSSQREIGGGNGSNNGNRRRPRRRRRGLDEGPSSPPPPPPPQPAGDDNNGVWPEPFLEALAIHLAIDAFQNFGRLAAARALYNLFQVCSTWRAVSRSDRLWQRLTSHVWGRDHLLRPTWRQEYIYRHQAAANFLSCRYSHALLDFAAATDDRAGLLCRSLTLSDTHLAAGFGDGTVRLFHLRTRRHVRTFRPRHRDHLGPFSRFVSGIVLSADRVVFASLDGDVHVAALHGGGGAPRRAVVGDAVGDGVLLDFAGLGRWWVGLFAGVPGRSFRVWDAVSEDLVYVGGSLTDSDAVMGWRQLSELTELVGRVRAAGRGSAVACTSGRVIVFELENGELVVREEAEYPAGWLNVAAVDASDSAYVVVDGGGEGSVRRVDTLDEVCRIAVLGGPAAQRRGGGGVVMGCINGGYALMCVRGRVRVWEVERYGQNLYQFGERVGEPTAMVADDRHVAAFFSDRSLHLWDFGPHQ